MTSIARSVPVSTVLAGDPLTLGPEVVSAEDVLRRCGLESVVPAGFLSVAPGVALVHALPVERGGIELRWLHLPHGPALVPGKAPVHTALLLTAPVSEVGRAVRVVATLMACVRDPGWMDATRSATTREALVRMLSRDVYLLPPGHAPAGGDTQAGREGAPVAKRVREAHP